MAYKTSLLCRLTAATRSIVRVLMSLLLSLCAPLCTPLLLPHDACGSAPYISEVLADNEEGIRDEDGSREDWIEITNPGSAAVALNGWWLTDKLSNPTQWRFPEVTIPAGETLLVWASSKNRAHPELPLHTSFSLSKGGEYLGLYRPDPATGQPVVVDEFAPAFPALPPDVSFGRGVLTSTINLISHSSLARWYVVTAAQGNTFYSGSNYAAGHLGYNLPGGWNSAPNFNDAAWSLSQTPLGWDNGGKYAYGTSPSGNIKSAMHQVNASMLTRIPFTITNLVNLRSLHLHIRYEDGFVAYINGVEVLRERFTPETLAWDSKADKCYDKPALPPEIETILTPEDVPSLCEGLNVLAIQGLNCSVGSTDFFISAALTATMDHGGMVEGYFSEPTPNAPNGAVTLGPLLFGATPADPNTPRPVGGANSPPITASLRVIAAGAPITAVRVYVRNMFDPELPPIALRDDGIAPDTKANDGIYAGLIPTAGITAGQMLRWRFEALDNAGRTTTLPAFTDPANSPQYFGTVAQDPSTATSQLPILEWFVQSAPANGPTAAAFRGSCYYLSNFYDNTGHSIHGQSTKSFAKKSYNFDFTREKRFLWSEDERRVKKVNLLSNYADKTKTRNTLSHWMGQQTGAVYHFTFPVRLQLNGGFHGVMDMMEKGDDRMLERNGLDPDGALYKIYNTDFLVNVEKKTRKEESNSDLAALYDALDPLRTTTIHAYTYDNLDLAATINYLATRLINSDSDYGHKNYFLYRDTNTTGEWQPIIWDVDLSYGHKYDSNNGGYFYDAILYNLMPLGTSGRVSKVITATPELRTMLLRRIRTLMDTYLQFPGTVDGIMESKMRQIVATIDPDPANPSPWTDGDLDAARWGFHANFIPNRPREEVERLVAEYFPQRRAYLFGSQPAISSQPIPGNAQLSTAGMVTFDSLEFNPPGGAAHEYIILRNRTNLAIDISGWRISGQVSHTFRPGTVIPNGTGTAANNYVGLLHLVKDARAFRTRPTGPTGGQRRFIQGNYKGQLSARGGQITLSDANGVVISTYSYAGAPTQAQQYLRVCEVQYHPAPPTRAELAALPGVLAEEFEYIELINLGQQPLDLSGAYFSEGITFTIPDSFTIARAQRFLVVKNPAAFALRYPNVTVPVLGPYLGFLDNAGETLALKEASGETIFSFTYKDSWYPHTDGSGRSLVTRDPTIPQYNALDVPTAWGICNSTLGTPGAPDSQTAESYQGWVHFRFTPAQGANPQIAGPYADPDGDGRVNWVEYALGTDPLTPDATSSLSLRFVTFTGKPFVALEHNRPRNCLDVEYTPLATSDLQWELWSPATFTNYGTTALTFNRERVVLRSTTPRTTPNHFYTMQLTFKPLGGSGQ